MATKNNNDDAKAPQADEEKSDNQDGQWQAKYLRALADYQNLEKRIRQEREELVRYAAEKIIYDLLDVLDILEKVAEHNNNDQGLQLGINHLRGVLKENGLKKIEATGKKFDPNMMECVEVVESDRDGEAVEEVRPGYLLYDKIIRVARVKVGKRKIEEENVDKSVKKNTV